MPAVYPARYPTDYLGGYLIGSLPGLVQKHELSIQLDFFKPGSEWVKERDNICSLTDEDSAAA